MNTNWLVGGPADTGVRHAIGDVPGCAVGNVIEFAIDLSQMGNPTSLKMAFVAKNSEVDGTSTVIVNLP